MFGILLGYILILGLYFWGVIREIQFSQGASMMFALPKFSMFNLSPFARMLENVAQIL